MQRLTVTKIEQKGTLPDPFLRADGTRLTDPGEWEAHRATLMASAVTLQYGTPPPAPEFLDIERLFVDGLGRGNSSYLLHTGRQNAPVTMTMHLFLPKGVERPPVVIDGDHCFLATFNTEWIRAYTDHGVALCLFNRTELAHDLREEWHAGQLFDAYPDGTFGTIGAWAWGYSRCADALVRLGLTDPDGIAFSGHSRGGKTALLAGILDERAAIVSAHQAGQGGGSCYRLRMEATVDGRTQRSETLRDLWTRYGYWLGAGMSDYLDREDDLPFDLHTFKALIAPRVLVLAESTHDIWSSPLGTWQTTQAAGEVYRFLGVPENLYWYYRDGGHLDTPEDVTRLVSVIRHVRDGEPLAPGFFEPTFDEPARMFDWRAP